MCQDAFTAVPRGRAGSNTDCLSVNQYRWINIWMAILGYFLDPLPAFFEVTHVLSELVTEIFPIDDANVLFYFAFSPRYRYKTPRAAHIKSARDLSCCHFQPG
ncbi:DUF2684 family protein [Escherichia coli]|nr:DUF2684 domain-containing protein [Enterobacteriaceae bacterium ENNIH1]RDT55922.1 DUF2684 family protein [Escherichia coli]